MASVAVVYHSGYGHTKVLAEAVVRGIKSVHGVTAHLLSVDELPPAGADRKLPAQWDVLHKADAIIFGSPTYMGTISADFKKFMESASIAWFGQLWKDKLAGGFTNSGSPSGDKLNALTTLSVFAAQQSMVWVSTGMMPSYGEGEDPKNINRIGSYLGAMAQSGNASPDVTPPVADKLTAEAYGKRLAEAALRWKRGAAH